MKVFLILFFLSLSLYAKDKADIESLKLTPEAKSLLSAHYQISDVIKEKDKKIETLSNQVLKLQKELEAELNITASIKESLGDINIEELQRKIERFNALEKQKKDALEEFKSHIKKYGRVVNSGNRYLFAINGKVYRTNSSINGYLIKEINLDYIRFYDFKIKFGK